MTEPTTVSKSTPTTHPSTPPSNLPEELEEIEFAVVIGLTLADAIRLGSQTTEQVEGWGNLADGTACALTAAQKEIQRRGYV
jgi:hypothetical protein